MAIAYLGSEALAYDSDGTINALLTIPVGTTHIVTSFGGDGTWDTATLGGVSLTKASAGEFFFGDISGRTTDYLSNTKTSGTWAFPLVHYLSGNDVQEWEVYSASANGDHRVTCAAPTNGGNVFGCFYGRGTLCDMTSPASAWGYYGDGTPIANNDVAGGCQETVGAADAAITAGFIMDALAGTPIIQVLFLYEAQAHPVFTPASFGVEAGFTSGEYGFEFNVGADVYLIPVRFGAEAGFAAGLSFRTSGRRQVMLTGSGIETPEMTTGGTTGQVLSFDEAGVPTWEDAAGTVASLDDVGDVDAAAPSDGDVLVWNDYLQAWVAEAPSGASVIDDLTDVDAAQPSDGDILVWNDYQQAWVAASVSTLGRWEPVVHDDGYGPEVVFDDGDIVMHFVTD